MKFSEKNWPRATEVLGIPGFRPHLFLGGGQRQTIIGKFTESELPRREAERIDLAFADGDKTYLEVDSPANADAKTPVVVLLHGLGGSSESSYLLRIGRKLAASGIRAVRFNHRGAGKVGGHLAKRIYHAGSAQDVLLGLEALESRFPDSQKALVGFSLSGAITLNLAAELSEIHRARLNVAGAMAVCAPLDLEESSISLAQLSNMHFDVYYTRMLKQRALQLHQLFPDHGYPILPTKLNLRIFDEVFTAPVGGFRNRDHYYGTNSPLEKLSKIQIPTMILQAADDPVVPAQVYRKINRLEHVRLVVEPIGGHMGFVSRQRTTHGDRRWMDVAVIRWCSMVLKQI